MILPAALVERLGPPEDPALWQAALDALAAEAGAWAADNAPAVSRLYAEVGCCSHWLRPHQTRWTAAGGFALPIGYGGTAGFAKSLPVFDWSVVLEFLPGECRWETPATSPPRRARLLRVTVPARTARHRQAALHVVWPKGTLAARDECTVYYGFRKVDGIWQLKARA